MTGTSPARRHLVIFAKTPRLGRVKSRLAKDVGRVAAWQFYRHNLNRMARRMSRDHRWQTWLAITPDRGSTGITHGTANTAVIGQGGGDLGQRMHRAMTRMPPGPVVIIGTDIPEIRQSDIACAFNALGHNDAVFGPATDGGYWLVGLKRRPRLPRAFEGVRWSGPHALSDTLQNLRARSCTVALLRELVDVDDLASWQCWKKDA